MRWDEESRTQKKRMKIEHGREQHKNVPGLIGFLDTKV
jgi:hypothetical protein